MAAADSMAAVASMVEAVVFMAAADFTAVQFFTAEADIAAPARAFMAGGRTASTAADSITTAAPASRLPTAITTISAGAFMDTGTNTIRPTTTTIIRGA